MSKKIKSCNRPPVGGEEFLGAMFEKAVEGDWAHVLMLTAVAINEKCVTNGWHLDAKTLSALSLAVQCLSVNYVRSVDKLN